MTLISHDSLIKGGSTFSLKDGLTRQAGSSLWVCWRGALGGAVFFLLYRERLVLANIFIVRQT